MKKQILLLFLTVNTLFILIYGNVDLLSLYNPSNIYSQTKTNTISFLLDLGLLKQSTLTFENKKQFFLKTITNQKVFIEEVSSEDYILPNTFVNKNEKNFILHTFDGKLTKNFIFYNPNDKIFPKNLLDLISLLTIHGSNDDGQFSFDEMLKIIEDRPLLISCGTNSIFTQNLLQTVGVKSRLVQSLTFDKWNSYDNGHTLLEVYSKNLGQWFLYDMDGQKVFKKDNKLLNLVELLSYGINNIDIISVSNQPFLDYSDFKYFLIGELIENNPTKWYKRVFQKLSIFDEEANKFVFLINQKDDCNKLNNYYNNSINCLDLKNFKYRFYK